MNSPCSYFAITLAGEGKRSSEDNGNGDGTTASYTALLDEGGGSPEVDVVAAARPGGKGREPHPGVPPISDGKRRQQ